MDKAINIEIYDPALCCSSGVCGVDADQQLISVNADLTWLKEQGVEVTRFNLAQQPMAFVENALVKNFLHTSGEEGLPLVLVNGAVVLTGRYPRRAELARWAGLSKSILPVQAVNTSCSGPSCC